MTLTYGALLQGASNQIDSRTTPSCRRAFRSDLGVAVTLYVQVAFSRSDLLKRLLQSC